MSLACFSATSYVVSRSSSFKDRRIFFRRLGDGSMRTGDSVSWTLAFPDDCCRSSGSGVLCLAISDVTISCAGSLSFDFAFLTALDESEGLLIRFLNESVDCPALAVGPLAARRVFGGIGTLILEIRWCGES